MSQQAMSNDSDSCENSQLPCQCSVISSVDSILQRERSERNLGSKRISKVQDLPRGLETLQNMFEPIRNREPSPSIEENQQSVDNSRSLESIDQSSLASSPKPVEVQKTMFSRYGHTLSCSPRSVDLSRNLAFEAARRVQETSNFQDNQHRQLSSPGSLLDSNSDLNEMSLHDMENDVDDGEDLSTSPTKEKINMQVLSSYKHHHEPGVHSHLLNESHTHIYKHENPCKHDTYCGSNLDSSDGMMGFQHPRQHSHHHHKISSLSHHQHQPSHSCGTTSNLSTYIYGTPGSLVTTPSPSPMNRENSQNIYHHPGTPTNNSNLSMMDHRNSPAAHHRLGLSGNGSRGNHHGTANFVDSSGHHHGTASVMSGTSSNSSLINHGSSPTIHRHVVNVNSNLSTTPLISHHHRSSSGSLTGNSTTNHHHVSSGISCESSSSNANTRTHSRLDHIHDHHHHHLQAVHALHSTLPDTRPRERTPSSMDHHTKHHSHVYTHNRSHSQNEAKHAALIGVNNIQVSTPSKNKCQCHMIQQGVGSKRGPEGESDGGGEVTLRTHQPPALPPRPPPRPARRFETVTSDPCQTGEGGCCKKYVVLCCLCGGLSATVGSLFLTIHVVISANTASLALFETVPSYIPGTMLILMGLFTMLLARRKHRYGLLMKVCGSVAVVCALVCVLVTVTTTVVHMSRLQGLRECVYTARAKSCTCYGATAQSRGDPGVLFEATPHCDVVQGTLYSCLRALFGTSVAGILVCIFSCMLLYQLLSHEKKKMYWEQLELRCRSLYGQGGAVRTVTGSCGCCSDCGGTSPWWAQTPGNLYTPNPDMAPSRRWRLPWSRSRGPAPSPDSNYGFHAQAMQAEANAENNTGPYSVLNSQSGGPYSVLNSQNGPYSSSTASYSVLEAPVPLWGPPPPYSDPNSPARRPQVPEARPRIGKRMENYESNEDYRPRVTKRPSDNYENAEEISNSTDPEGGNEGTIKSRRLRKPLKGVENGAFQQEPNPAPKQSESELYFGDVSSCCGPESSFYDLAVDKEAAEHPEGVDYLAARLGKRQLSKRSRHPLPLPLDGSDVPSNSYSNTDESRNARGPYLAPDAQYEVIQQGRYAYYSSKADEEHKEGATTSAYFREEDTEREREREREKERNREREYRDYRSNQEEETPQCCLSDSTTLDSGWQSGEQQHSDDNVRPVNV